MKDLFLIIDMQNVYGKGGQWYCPKTAEASGRIRSLLHKVEGKLDVIFTRFLAAEEPEGVWQQYNEENAEVNQDAWSNEMMAEFKEHLQKYPLYTKSTYSSLTIPEVLEAAKAAGRVIVAGVVAECCVLATVLALVDEGIPVIYLTDGVAGIDNGTEAAVETVLAGLEPLHVKRMTTEEYLETVF